MLRFLIVLAAVLSFSATLEIVSQSVLEAQRGGRGGRGGGGRGYGKGKGYGKGSKGPTQEEIEKLKEKYPDTWEEKLKDMRKKGYKGKNDVKTDLVPDWKQQRLETWVQATDKDLPIVLAFVAKKDEVNAKYLVHKKAADLSRKGAVFVWLLEGQKQIVTKKNDQAEKIKGFGEDKPRGLTEEEKAKREKNLEILKRSRLSQANLWEAYGVTKANSFIICDQFGNEFKRYKTKPSGTSICSAVGKIEKQVKSANSAAQEVCTKADELLEKEKLAEAVSALVEGNEKKHVGYEYAEKMHEMLEDIIEEHEDALEEAIEAKNNAALKAMTKTFAGTRIAAGAHKALGTEPATKKKKRK